MGKKWVFIIIGLLVFGCASSASLRSNEDVTIILKNGDEIKAQVMDIHHDQVIFKATSWKQAYEYGEILNIARIKGIKIADGSLLSVQQYEDYRKGKRVEPEKNESPKVIAEASPKESELTAESQYEQLKKKPISEMTDHEFEFFMMMKKQELEAQKQESSKASGTEKIGNTPEEGTLETIPEPEAEMPVTETPGIGLHVPYQPVTPVETATNVELGEVAASMLDADLAARYLNYLHKKQQSGEPLTVAEKGLQRLIENDTRWKEKVDDLNYIDRAVRNALSRAYLYNPEELSSKLNLKFDANLEMDYSDLMTQLHRSLGEDVNMTDFRTMVEVLGESGARAVKELLKNYSTWRFVVQNSQPIVTK